MLKHANSDEKAMNKYKENYKTKNIFQQICPNRQ